MTATLNEDLLYAASSPAGFAWVATRGDADPYVPADFHLKLAESIVDIEQARLELLIVTYPVQHGKSSTASVWGSAWMLGLHPTWLGVAATYNTDFAEDRIGRPTRDILERFGAQFFGVHVDQSSRSMKRWNTTQKGGLISVGVDKPVTGRRADFIVVDDPYPGIEEAMNPRFRAAVVQWFEANILPRRPDPLRMIAIMSRWTDDDFIAYLTDKAKKNGWKYRVLDFPAIARCPVKDCLAPEFRFVQIDDSESGYTTAEMDVCKHGKRDELGRLPGQALWPAVRPIAFLIRQLVDMKPRLFNALFQGRPDKPGGSIFKKQWFRYARQDGDIIHLLDQSGNLLTSYRKSQCNVFQIVDLASGDTQTLRSGITRTKPKGDYTVIGTFLLCPRYELVVYDIFRDNKIGGVEQIPMLGSLRAKHGATRIGIEAVQFQWTAVQQAVAAGLPARAITRGQESKETRAWTVAGRMEAGLVYFMRDAPWLEGFEAEILAFPNGKHDDQADVLSDAGVVADERVSQSASTPQGVRVE